MEWHTNLHPDARVAFDNLPYNAVAYWPFIRPDGRPGIQSRVRVWDGVLVVALDHATHEVYVKSQTRESTAGPITTVELPGGGIDPGDTPLATAKQELREEAGVEDEREEDWISLSPPSGFHPIPGLVVTSSHAFLVLAGVRKYAALDGEVSGLTTMPFSRLLEMDRNNEFSEPLSPYAIRRAYDWLQEYAPHLLT